MYVNGVLLNEYHVISPVPQFRFLAQKIDEKRYPNDKVNHVVLDPHGQQVIHFCHLNAVRLSLLPQARDKELLVISLSTSP